MVPVGTYTSDDRAHGLFALLNEYWQGICGIGMVIRPIFLYRRGSYQLVLRLMMKWRHSMTNPAPSKSPKL
jgi:hypothetical protein